MNADISLIDTNILVYAYDRSEREKHPLCRELIKRCWTTEAKHAISIQNLSEFFVIITSKIENPVSVETAEKRVERIIEFSNWVKIKPEIHTISPAIRLCKRYKVHYFDALLAATMKENGVFRIYTENEVDFSKIPWLVVENPVK